MKLYLTTFICLLSVNLAYSNLQLQISNISNDTIPSSKSAFNRIKPIIVPMVLITHGLICMKNYENDPLNNTIKSYVLHDQGKKSAIDDYTQYLPTAAFLSLDYLGISTKHNLKQKLYAGSLSHIIMAATVNIMKYQIDVMRPDGSSNNSFPSGHTATAFVGAELLWQESHHQSPWYGIAGYAIASATGFFRMYNNRHWFSDITMAAGIGIVSTKISYYLLPIIDKWVSRKDNNYILFPRYHNKTIRLTYIKSL